MVFSKKPKKQTSPKALRTVELFGKLHETWQRLGRPRTKNPLNNAFWKILLI